MALSAATAVFLASITGIPISYLINSLQKLHDPLIVLIVGVIALAFVIGLTFFLIDSKKSKEPLFYIFSICCFSSVIDIIISLENDGIIKNFMTFYLENGEPYLRSAHGTWICYWDGVGHYAMYLMMLSAMSWNQNYRGCGLYWVGSILHSLIVFLPANVLGKYGVKPSFLLNVPYCFVPVWAGLKFLGQRPKAIISAENVEKYHTSICKRPFDMLIILYFIFAIIFAFFRGFTALGCNEWFLKEYEPYIGDPVYYARMQMMVYLFYFVPYYLVSIYALIYPGCSWMPDWSLIHAGAAMQIVIMFSLDITMIVQSRKRSYFEGLFSKAQVAHIGSSIHPRTSFTFRIPNTYQARSVFWITNLLLMVIPQVIALRCTGNLKFFCDARPRTEENHDESVANENKESTAKHSKSD